MGSLFETVFFVSFLQCRKAKNAEKQKPKKYSMDNKCTSHFIPNSPILVSLLGVSKITPTRTRIMIGHLYLPGKLLVPGQNVLDCTTDLEKDCLTNVNLMSLITI